MKKTITVLIASIIILTIAACAPVKKNTYDQQQNLSFDPMNINSVAIMPLQNAHLVPPDTADYVTRRLKGAIKTSDRQIAIVEERMASALMKNWHLIEKWNALHTDTGFVTPGSELLFELRRVLQCETALEMSVIKCDTTGTEKSTTLSMVLMQTQDISLQAEIRLISLNTGEVMWSEVIEGVGQALEPPADFTKAVDEYMRQAYLVLPLNYREKQRSAY